MAHDHDALFRHTFSDPHHAAALLQDILPADLSRALDWTTLALVPGTFVDAALRQRCTDLLFSALVAGHGVLLYVVLEHKSHDDRFTALQLLRYVVRIADRFLQEHPDAKFLPPIVPIVVHHGPRAWNAPRTVLDLVDLSVFPPAVQRVLSPLQPNLHFLLDDLASVPEHQLRSRPTTPCGTLTLLALQFVRDAMEGDPVAFAERWLPLWRALWSDPSGRFGLTALFSYLAAHLEAPPERFVAAAARIHEDAENMGKTIAEQLVAKGKAEGLAMGKAEGRIEGRTEGRVDLLLRLMRRRFRVIPPAIEQRVRTADADSLDLWGDRILSAATLDDLFA